MAELHKSDLTQIQEENLKARSAAAGSCSDLAHFYAVLGELSALRDLESRAQPGDALGLLTLDVALLGEEAGRYERVATQLEGQSDPWLYYTVGKFLLGQDRVAEAVRVAVWAIAADPKNTVVLNLIVEYLAHKGDFALAAELAERAVKRNPQQRDMEAFLTSASRDASGFPEPYLDVRPRYEQVSFYLPVHNVERFIRATLEGLVHQCYPLHEILVIDDGSEDGSIEFAQTFPVRIIRHRQNKGLAAARNTAFQHAATPFLGALDTDATPEPGLTKYMMMEFENASPDVVGVGGRLIEHYQDNAPDHWRAVNLTQDPGGFRIAPAGAITGSKTIFRRDAVLEVGGYNEKYRTNNEDVDLCARLTDRGYTLVNTPYAIAHHMRTDTVQSALRTCWNWTFWGRYEAGGFRSKEQVFHNLCVEVENALTLIEADEREGHADLLYIDFLYPFHAACMDLDFAVKESVVTPEEASAVKDTTLQVIPGLNARFGPRLYEAVRRDLSHFVPSNAANPSENKADFPGFGDFLATLKQILGAFDDVWYEKVAEAAG